MRITRLRLSDFKTHASLDIKPAAGLTVIRGPNEAGKSSIAQAIELALFCKADAEREDVRQAWAWGASEPPEVRIEFDFEGQAGTLVKRFGGARSEGELTIDGRAGTDGALIAEKLADITGIPSEAFFRATAKVGHSELDRVGGDEPELHDRLQQAVSGADRGTATAKKMLEAAVRRYRTEGPKNPGLLKVVREEIAMLEGELANGEAALARLGSDRAQWVTAHERREELEVQLRRQQADLAEAQRAEALAMRRDRAAEQYERLKRAASLVEEGERLRGHMPTAIPLVQLRSAASHARGLDFEISELEAEVSIVDATADDGGELPTAPPRPLRWLALAAVFVALGALASFLLGATGLLGGIVMLALAVCVVVCLAQAVRLAGRRRQYGLAMRLAESASMQRADVDRAQQEQFRRARRELESTLAGIGVDDVEAAEALLASTEKQTEALAYIEGELHGLGIKETNLRRLVEARDEAASETERASHALVALGSRADDPASILASVQRLLAQTLPARDAARSEEDQAQGRVDSNQVDAEMVAGLAERLSAARERQVELDRRVLVYQGTLAAIESAERATLKTAARFLEERMGPMIARLTDGRYDDIQVDERNLAFRVRAPETAEFVDVRQLSQGTADQLFLAARLGLVRLVTMDRRPPLILDDSFVTFDTTRGERAVRLVKQFAAEQGFQVLYLTCSDRFDKLADELVVLPGPSNERVLALPRQAPAKPATAERGAATTAVAKTVAAGASRPDAPAPTLRFAPDPRPNPDPVAPRRDTDGAAAKPARSAEAAKPARSAESVPASPRPARVPPRPAVAPEANEPDPLESLRRAAEAATEAERDTGIADPFGLRRGSRDEVSD